MSDCKENVYKKGCKLSWVNKYSSSEIALLVLASFSPILLIKETEEIFVLYIVLFISALLSLREEISNFHRLWSLFHKAVFLLSFLVLLLVLIFRVLFEYEISINNPILFIIILVGFFAYSSVLFMSLLFCLNLLFFIVLKFIFPYDNGDRSELLTYNLKDLSSYMSLPNQVAYLLLRIFYSIIYLIFISMVTGWIAKFSDKKSENSGIAIIETWIVNSGFITLGNTIGVLSILLTLLTVTLPISYRIINVASIRYEEEREKTNF